MSNLSSFVKRIRDVMRNDAGINGDAQRIEQIAMGGTKPNIQAFGRNCGN